MASASGLRPAQIARNLACARGTVRDAIHGREVRNSESLVRPEVLDAFRDLPELR